MQFKSFRGLVVMGVIIPFSVNMASFLYFGGIFNKTIIPLVGI